MKFTYNGVIKIVASYDAENELLKVQVIDSGVGIRESEMSKLFKIFSKE